MVYADSTNSGYIYTSDDSGATWIEHSDLGSQGWTSIASSSDGTRLATADSGGYIYLSADGGSTWTSQTASPGTAYWSDIASSADGTRLVANVGFGHTYTYLSSAVTSPTLSAPTAASITTSGATLSASITADGGGAAILRGFLWGLSILYGNTTTESGIFGASSYSTALTGLLPSTLYHYQSYATNSAGSAYSADQTFTTAAEATIAAAASADDTENVEVSDIEYETTENTLTVTWKTNHDADSKVRYGTDKDLKKEKYDDTNEEKHKVTIKDLAPGTGYYFRVSSEDEDDEKDSSRIYSVTTEAYEETSLSSVSLTPVADLPTYESLVVTGEREDEESGGEQSSSGSAEAPDPAIQEAILEKVEKVFETKMHKDDEQQIIETIKFQIVDANDDPIAGLPVTLHSDPQQTVTDESGIATFADVPTGDHTLLFAYADKEYEKSITIEDVQDDADLIRAEVVVIKVAKEERSYWAWGVIACLFILLAGVLVAYVRLLREQKTSL